MDESKLARELARRLKKIDGVWQVPAAAVEDLLGAPEAAAAIGAAMLARAGIKLGAMLSTIYDVRHWRRGELIWEGRSHNTVTTEGVNRLLTDSLIIGAGENWYIGLITSTGFSAYSTGDTSAKITTGTPSGGTNGWQESVAYSGARVAWTPGAASAGAISNSASPASFAIDASDTIQGLFMANASARGPGAGTTLYGEGNLTTSRSVLNGDTLLVTATVSLTAS